MGVQFEIKCIMYLGISGYAWVSVGYLEKVQCNEGLGKKLTPKAQGKREIDAAEGCNEMSFPSAYGAFSSITAMGSSGCELKSNYVVHHEVLEQVRG